jgi:hypothetical protein
MALLAPPPSLVLDEKTFEGALQEVLESSLVKGEIASEGLAEKGEIEKPLKESSAEIEHFEEEPSED